MSTHHGPPTDVPSVLARIKRPKRVVVTAGMPYANGPVHIGHIAGAHLPADIYARYMGMLVGRQNVLFVCGTDDHGSTTEVSALQKGVSPRELVDEMHGAHESTLRRYGIALDAYSGTSRPECFPHHVALCQDFLTKLHANGLLEKRTSPQWYDPKAERFLPDRLVRGKCPNPKCDNTDAYSDECEVCGRQYAPTELLEPRSAVSDAIPERRDTTHWWLDMGAVSETLRIWLQGKQKQWRPAVLAETLETVLPALSFGKDDEDRFKALSHSLPKHRRKYAPGRRIVLQVDDVAALDAARRTLNDSGIATAPVDAWAKRSITRDIAWGVPVPDVDPELAGKTLYVWPDSLIAPISFTKVALGAHADRWPEFWCDPDARITQFLGQDNVFFYVVMQGAMWLGTQPDPHRLPLPGELQLTDVVGQCHLMVGGEKMSKSKGNFYTGDQLLDEMGYTGDQLRYYLALLDLSERPSDFDRAMLDARNKFLAGPMNAAFERPISACHSKFGGRVPDGRLSEKAVADTVRIVGKYVRAMEKADWHALLTDVEEYARTINSQFQQFKPQDDRHPYESRADALYTCFYVLKTLMILLYPFVPETMERLRQSLRLPADVFRVEELGVPIPAGHEVGEKLVYFPAVPE